MNDDQPDPATIPLRVAAIGGDASWPATEAVLAQLPARPGFAVIALADADDIGTAIERLAVRAELPIVPANDGDRVDVDRAYVVAKHHDVVIERGRLRLKPPAHGVRTKLDRLLRSLADEVGGAATAVVLSGSGVDGSLGIRRLKEAGGLVIVQAPDDAETDEMPRAAIASGAADLVLHTRDIARRLVDLAKGPDPALIDDRRLEETAATEAMRDILTLVRVRTGHDFSAYKKATLSRRVARRMQVYQCRSVEEYLTYLREHPGELGGLLRDFLISVTNFFREPEAFAILQQQVVPQLFADKRRGDQVRVWAVGCATGEEAYSIAMVLAEHAARLDDAARIQVFATDIDDDALVEARAGRYPDTIAADVPAPLLERYFTREGAYYRVAKQLRELVLFSPHNVLRDPPFSRLDLITCRNLLIYLNRDAQDRVLSVFHFGLRPEGFLFLGSSESAESAPHQFAVVDARHRIYARGRIPSSLQVDAILPTGRWQLTTSVSALTDAAGERALPVGEMHHRLVERYAPPSILVNDELDILHVSEHAGRYLTIAGGEPSRNLVRLVHPALQLDLRAAIFAAKQPGDGRDTRAVRFVDDGVERVVQLSVQLVDIRELGRGVALVVLDERPSAEAGGVAPSAVAAADSSAIEPVVRALENDLHRTRDHLRSTIERYETSLEELKASNEELHSINEELRSATEELETSKEELQSVNEELTTLNLELKINVDELGHANSDLQNLMTSTDIAVVFLDRDLNLKRFTERARDLFNVINSDIGRPFAHLTHKLDSDGLADAAAEVLRTLRAVEREVRSKDGRRYFGRLLPYRSLDDRIDGVVLTFFNVTELRRAEDALRDRNAMLRLAELAAGAGFWELDTAIGVVRMTEACQRLHGLSGNLSVTLATMMGRVIDTDRARFDRAVRVSIATGDDLDVEYRVAANGAGEAWLWTIGRVVRAPGDGVPAVISGITVDLAADAPSQRTGRR